MNAIVRLPEAQQGVIRMYDTEIRAAKRERQYLEGQLEFGEAYRMTLKIEELEAERESVVEKFLS